MLLIQILLAAGALYYFLSAVVSLVSIVFTLLGMAFSGLNRLRHKAEWAIINTLLPILEERDRKRAEKLTQKLGNR